MSKRKAEDDLWEHQKEKLHRLYVDQDTALKDVMTIMASCHGFKKTKAQYERIFRKWKWNKNTTSDIWRFVDHRIKKRKAEGKASELHMNGISVPEEKLKKEVARYEFGNAFGALSSPQTPPNILISTPHIITDGTILDSSPAPFPRPFSSEELVLLAQGTPWKLFHEFTEKLYKPDSTLALTMSQSPQLLNFEAIPLINVYQAHELPQFSEQPSPRMTNRMQEWLDEFTLFTYTQETPQPFAPFSFYLNPTPFIPFLETENYPRNQIEVGSDLTRRSTQLEWLKMAVFLMSNNQAENSLIFTFVELCQDKANRRLLQKLLDEKFLSVAAFAEKLLTPAVSVGNMTLMTLLLDAGASPDAKGHPGNPLPCSPLQCAISQHRREFVKALLDRGADPSVFGRLEPFMYSGLLAETSLAETNLDLAVLGGNTAIVDEVMLPRTPFGHVNPPVTVTSICLAIRQNDMSMLHFLLRRSPSLVQSLIEESPRVLELAAFYGYVEIVDALIEYGADVKQTHAQGNGSALAAAAYGGHIQAVLHLLFLGASIDGISSWVQFNIRDPCMYAFYNNQKSVYFGLSSLSFASLGNNEELVRLLLENGADTNQSLSAACDVRMPTAIQLAAWKGTKSMVHALLRAGANPNQPPSYFPKDYSPANDFFHSIRPLDGQTALQLAMERGDYEITQLLLRHGAVIHATGEMGMNNLTAALRGQDVSILELFFGSELPFDDLDTALQACIEYNRVDLSQRILGISFNSQDPGPLCAAVYRRNLEIVEMLLSRASIVHGNFPGYAASGLAMAARLCDIEMIKLFLRADIKPYIEVPQDVFSVGRPKIFSDLQLSKGTCAIEELAKVAGFYQNGGMQRQTTAAKLLIGSCADENEMNSSLQSIKIQSALDQALLFAVAARNWPIARLLLQSGGDASAQHENGATCLQYAIQPGRRWFTDSNYEMVKLLLERGAEANITCREALAFGWGGDGNILRIFYIPPHTIWQNNTPLQNAVTTNRTELVRLLLQHGAAVNAAPREISGATALQYAAIDGNFEIANLLLQAGADVNAGRGKRSGRTAIEGAAEWGRLDMVRYLLALGADVKGKNNGQYRRAVYRAWKGGYMTLIRMVQEFKAENYGPEDCCSVKDIVDTMCDKELEYADYEERKEYYDERQRTGIVVC